MMQLANIIQREILGHKIIFISYLGVIIVNTGMLIHAKWYWLYYVSGPDPEGVFAGGGGANAGSISKNQIWGQLQGVGVQLNPVASPGSGTVFLK